MKSILTFAIACCLNVALIGQTDAIDRFFQSYQENEAFTMVYVSPRMFQMASKAVSEKDDKELKELVKDIKGLKILTTESNGMKYYNEAIKKIPTKEYEVLMTVRDKTSNVKFLTKESGPNVIQELLLLVGDTDSFVLMSFVGNLDLDKIAKLAQKLDIEGVEHLKNLDKK